MTDSKVLFFIWFSALSKILDGGSSSLNVSRNIIDANSSHSYSSSLFNATPKMMIINEIDSANKSISNLIKKKSLITEYRKQQKKRYIDMEF